MDINNNNNIYLQQYVARKTTSLRGTEEMKGIWLG